MATRSGRQLERFVKNADRTFGPAFNLSEAAMLRLNTDERLLPQSSEVHSPRSETNINKLVHELEVHQIELEMQNLELRQTKAELEVTNKELEAFNYSVAHDLCSPLIWIGGYIRTVLKHNGKHLDSLYRGNLVEVSKGIEKMERHIESLLNFSRQTIKPIHLTQVNLSAIVNDIVDELKMTEPERTVNFHISEGVVGKGDPNLLRIALQNLLNNAWKFTRNQLEVVIEFGITEDERKMDYFVRDNGPGFDMVLAEKLFTPFQRLGEIDVEGNGIGLAIVQRIVMRHGGRVWAESEPGNGATFFFTLE